jgi:NAD(P)-dependent dehydrogenase (short-subunit alcohol dehydrogenase family)
MMKWLQTVSISIVTANSILEVQMLVLEFNKIYENVPIKGVGQPEDIASIVSYLVSKEAHFITGEFTYSSSRLPFTHE